MPLPIWLRASAAMLAACCAGCLLPMPAKSSITVDRVRDPNAVVRALEDFVVKYNYDSEVEPQPNFGVWHVVLKARAKPFGIGGAPRSWTGPARIAISGGRVGTVSFFFEGDDPRTTSNPVIRDLDAALRRVFGSRLRYQHQPGGWELVTT